MKAHSPFRYILSIVITLPFLILLSANTSFAQSNPELEVMVYFKSGVQRVAFGQIQTEVSPQIQTVLDRFAISTQNVLAAFPEFEEADTLITLQDGRSIKRMNMSNVFRVVVPANQNKNEVIQILSNLPQVLFAEPNGLGETCETEPTDEYFQDGYQWGLDGQYGIDAPNAWDIYTGSSTSIIAILDTGVMLNHEDLDEKVSGDGPGPQQQIYNNFHGTHVAGIAAAETNDPYETGVAGVDWNATMRSWRVLGLDKDDQDKYDAIVAAVNYSSNVLVLNNSWRIRYPGGEPRYSSVVREAFAYAYKMNRVAVVSMGNEGNDQTQYPAGFGQGIIAVGAIQSDGDIWDDSSYGSHIDVVAPGVHILSTDPRLGTFPDPLYDYRNGTSMASPHVSGIATLLKGYAPTLDNDDIEQIIRRGTVDRGDQGWDEYYGEGLVKPDKALNYLREPFLLDHYMTRGGTDQGVYGPYTMTFYGVPELSDGEYIVKRHEIRKDESFPARDSLQVWGRGVDSNGWSSDNPNYGMGWTGVVPNSVDPDEATLRTYVYEVWMDEVEQWEWFPSDPSRVTMYYTTHGITAGGPLGLPSAPTGLIGDYFPPNHGGPKVHLEWNRNPSGEWVDKYWLERAVEEGEFMILSRNIPDPGPGSPVTYDNLNPPPAEYLRYRVKAHNEYGWGPFCTPIIVELGEDPFESSGAESIPTQLKLDPNYPNPFNLNTQIKFGLPSTSHVRLQIMNVRGQTVRVLVDEEKPAGWFTVTWDGKNESGREVASGIYLYIIEADNKKILKRLTLIR